MKAPDFTPGAFWDRERESVASPDAALPASVDAAIIGAGYTGLSAAREIARAGRSTLVFDQGPIGGGCSSRNGGQVAFSLKPSRAELTARCGADVAAALYEEGRAAVSELSELIAREGLVCDWRRVGGFVGAHTPRHFDRLVRASEAVAVDTGTRITVIPKNRQCEEIDSPLYHGGVVYHDEYAVQPRKLVDALAARAQAAGALLSAHCRVDGLQRVADGFELLTARGRVTARQVLIATNGYSGALVPWLRRRVMPIGSYILATEMLDAELVRRLIPRARNVGDTRQVVIYLRPSEDGRRILFGGRAHAGETNVERCLPRLRAMLAEVFPVLERVKISNAWMGFVGFTFDRMPHVGEHDGLFYALGYCGQGIPSATYYGRKVGLRMVGGAGGETALSALDFPSRWYYQGRPWFLPAAVLGYRLRDQLGL